MTLSILFHVNHLWGSGHYARIAAIANAVVDAGGAATILAGNTPLPGRLAPAVRLVELPPVRSPDATYARLVDANGEAPSAELWSKRQSVIDTALTEAAPDILATEAFPFGRRKLSAELLHLVAAAKARGAKIVASLRDLPTPPGDDRRLAECADRLRAHYDAVLVHGDPSVFGLNEIWPGEVPVPMRTTGYVVTPVPPTTEARSGVIVSAGGGGNAAPVLRMALAARLQGFLADEDWTLVTGPSAPGGLIEELTRIAPARTTLHCALPDLPQRIAKARLAIGRGGYNATVETLAAGSPLVVIPYAPPGEPEQAIRARRFAELGLLTALGETTLTPHALIHAAQHALAHPPPPETGLNTNGAAASAALLAEIASGG